MRADISAVGEDFVKFKCRRYHHDPAADCLPPPEWCHNARLRLIDSVSSDKPQICQFSLQNWPALFLYETRAVDRLL
jgi:hypothetical protein